MLCGGTLPALSGLATSGQFGSTVAATEASLVVATVAVSASVCGGGGLAVRGGSVDISVLAPGLGAPLVVILVVPFVVGLSGIRLGVGLAVGLGDAQVLIAAPGVPVGSRGLLVVGAVGLGGSLFDFRLRVLNSGLIHCMSMAVATEATVSIIAERLNINSIDNSNECCCESERFHVGS